MNRKRILLDPSFWLLIVINLLLLYNYEQDHRIFVTLFALYWSQNILYWLFNLLNVATSKKVKLPNLIIHGDNTSMDRQGPSAGYVFRLSQLVFFAFHLAYLIFLVSFYKKSEPFQWDFYYKYVFIFFISQLIHFIFYKIYHGKEAIDISKVPMLPFLRVIPMHLCILIPAFLNVSDLTIFLVLKIIVDVMMYVVTNTHYKTLSITESLESMKPI